MGWFRDFARSSIGMKQLMAVTGLGLALFVLIHMLGNLQLFIGRDALNTYAMNLHALGPLLWIARLGLLALIIIHIWAGLRVISLNRLARPIKYKRLEPVKSRWYSRYMAMSGILLLVFVAYHLLHFTAGTVQADAYQMWELPSGEIVSLFQDGARHDVYGMVVNGFSNPLIAGFYLVAMGLLCMHLAHGVTSFLQTLGLNHPKYNGLFTKVGPLYGVAIFVGNISMPVAVLAGWVKL